MKLYLKKASINTLILLCLFFESAYAVTPRQSETETSKFTRKTPPKIGLVLSGGGAKGLAHVGVLKIIDELGIRIDYISGTSMGSLVGACYAMGYNGIKLEKIALKFDWYGSLNDKISRKYISMNEKNTESRYIGTFELSEKGVKLPSGMVTGQRFLNQITWICRPSLLEKNFINLPTPFLCVATDAVTGETVILDKGYLPDAIRASMSIPTVFAPKKINNRLLIDGGITRNFPVSDVKDMGADIVIGIDVGAPLYKEKELDSFAKIMEQSVSFLGDKSTIKQRKLCDILILPDVKGHSSMDFDDPVLLIKKGEDAAKKVMPQLLKLAKKLKKLNIKPIPHKLDLPVDKDHLIKGIKFQGLKKVSPRLIKGKINIKTPGYVNDKKINQNIEKIYASRFFNEVSYKYEKSDDGEILVFRLNERSADYLSFGFNYNSESNASLILNATFRNFLCNGGRFSIDAKLGKETYLVMEHYIFSGWTPDVGIGYNIEGFNRNINAYDNGKPVAQYEYISYSGSLFLQANFFNFIALGGKLKKTGLNITDSISREELDDSAQEQFAYRTYLKLDTMDRGVYPMSGISLYADAGQITSALAFSDKDSFDSFEQMTFSMNAAIPVCRYFSILVNTSSGLRRGGDDNPVAFYSLGGVQEYNKIYNITFVGLNPSEIWARNVWTAGMGVRIRFPKNIYSTLYYNHGGFSDTITDLYKNKNTIYGYGAGVGMLTPIGPVEFTLMKGSEHGGLLYHVNIGFSF